jgi:hypothetical protein
MYHVSTMKLEFERQTLLDQMIHAIYLHYCHDACCCQQQDACNTL